MNHGRHVVRNLGIISLCLCAGAQGLTPHPRIFITAADIPRLRAMARDNSPNNLGISPAAAWSEILANAERLAAAGPYHYRVNMPGREGGPSQWWEYTLSDEVPPRHDDYSHYPPWTAMFQERGDSISTRLKLFLLAYIVTGEDAWFERAREIVFHLCAWDIPIWQDPSTSPDRPSLCTSHAAVWVAIFYDWCHDRLDADQRRLVRNSLIEKALVHADAKIDGMAPYHNISLLVGVGLCMGSIAILDEEPRAQGWLAHGIERLKLNFAAQGKDGGAMEGPGYGTYATDNLADVIWALQTAGIDSDLATHPYVKSMPRYCISLLDPNSNRQPCFGDGGPTQGFGRLNLALALQGDTDAAWYCKQIGMFDAITPRTFIAMDPGKVTPQQPSFNPSDAFVDIGYAILRDGFAPGPAFMAFKCGPPTSKIGHNHYDHNSFMLNFNGTWIGWDPGYRSYFNPPVRKYTVGTIGHSTILVDLSEDFLADHTLPKPGHEQVHLAGGRIREFATNSAFDYVLGSAADTYNTANLKLLDRFDRQIIFAKPDVFFIRDTLAAGEPHTYSALFHVNAAGDFSLGDSAATARGQATAMQIAPFSPAGITLTKGLYEGAERYGAYLAATTGRTNATSITTVLVPRRDDLLFHNTGFESGMTGWTPRTAQNQLANHVIDTETAHSGKASARIDNNGYYYTQRVSLPPGTRITLRWWAKCTAPEGASSILYHSHEGKSVKRTPGPAARVNEWQQYELSDTVPEGASQTVLALQFFGTGQCWYDDLEVSLDPAPAQTPPAQITPIAAGAGGALVRTDSRSVILLCGTPGTTTTQQTGGHAISFDGELAVVCIAADGVRGCLLRGTTLTLDGTPVPIEPFTWREGPL